MTTFYDLSDKDIKGNTVSMSTFQGKVLVLVNVASECGRTHSNYTQLPKLLQEYPSLEILAFPCNQFGGQEPGTHEMICNHVQTKFPGTTERFHFFEKANVNGTNAREVYQFIKTQLAVDNIGWNFDIFVVTSTGEPYKYIPSSGTPYEKVKNVLDTLAAKECMKS